MKLGKDALLSRIDTKRLGHAHSYANTVAIKCYEVGACTNAFSHGNAIRMSMTLQEARRGLRRARAAGQQVLRLFRLHVGDDGNRAGGRRRRGLVEAAQSATPAQGPLVRPAPAVMQLAELVRPVVTQ